MKISRIIITIFSLLILNGIADCAIKEKSEDRTSYLLEEAAKIEKKVKTSTYQKKAPKTIIHNGLFYGEEARNVGFKWWWKDDPGCKNVPFYVIGFTQYHENENEEEYNIKIGLSKTFKLKHTFSVFYDDNGNGLLDNGETVTNFSEFWINTFSFGLKKDLWNKFKNWQSPYYGINIGFLYYHNSNFNNGGFDLGLELGYAFLLFNTIEISPAINYNYTYMFRENDLKGHSGEWENLKNNDGADLFYTVKGTCYF